jgi:chromosome segregation ATPase
MAGRISVILAMLIAGLVAVRKADAYRRYRHSSYSYSAARARQQQAVVRAATAQLNAAKDVLAAAQLSGGAAQSKLNASLAKLREEAQKFHDAQSTTRHLAKELAEIEQDIIEEQKDDSPYSKAGKQVETARAKLKEIEQRVLAEPDVQSRLSGLTGGKLDETKASILSLRTEYLIAKSDLATAGSELARIRSELFQADKDWKEAAEALTQARKDERAAEEMTHSGASGRVGALQTAKSAGEAAAAARAAIAQAEAVIKANGAYRKPPSPGASQNPLNNKDRKK